jgi:hypothetical protein
MFDIENNLFFCLAERGYALRISAENADIVRILLEQYEKILKKHNPIIENANQKFDQAYIKSLYHLGFFSVVLSEKMGGIAIDPESLSFMLMYIAERDSSLALALLDHVFSLLILSNADTVEMSEGIFAKIAESPLFISSASVVNLQPETVGFILEPHCARLPDDVKRYVLMKAADSQDGDSIELIMLGLEELVQGKSSTIFVNMVSQENILKNNVLYSHDRSKKNIIKLKKVDILKLCKQHQAYSAVVVAGIARRAVRKYLDWCGGRHLFGKNLSRFQLIQHESTQCYAMLAAILGAVITLLPRENTISQKIAASLVRFVGEAGFCVADKLFRLYGGSGYFEQTGIPQLIRNAKYHSLYTRVEKGVTEICEVITWLLSLFGDGPFLQNINLFLRTVNDSINDDPIESKEKMEIAERIVSYLLMLVCLRHFQNGEDIEMEWSLVEEIVKLEEVELSAKFIVYNI